MKRGPCVTPHTRAGKWAWWAAWLYGSICSAVFLVRTIKRVLFQEARSYGELFALCSAALACSPCRRASSAAALFLCGTASNDDAPAACVPCLRRAGPNLTLTNYLLLALAAMQFPLLMWLCGVQLPTWSLHHATAAAAAAAGGAGAVGAAAGGATGAATSSSPVASAAAALGKAVGKAALGGALGSQAAGGGALGGGAAGGGGGNAAAGLGKAA